jgi:hypothetical protein
MTEFAAETARHRETVLRGGSFSFGFGPATPGQLDVILSASQPQIVARRRSGLSGRGSSTAPARPLVARARPGVGPPSHPGFGDLLDGGLAPDPPDREPPNRIVPTAFRMEVFDAHGRSVGAGQGPLLQLDVPAPAGPPGGGAAAPVAVRDTWRVEVTNNSSFEAAVWVEVRFQGVRPIVSKPFELGFINERFEVLFNRVQPLRLRFENRDVPVPLPNGGSIALPTTFFVVDAIESWQIAHPVLRDLEFDLGAQVFTEVTESASITVRACVHDGAPAIRVRVRFQSARGVIDLLNLLSIWSSTLASIGGLITDLTPADRPTVEIGQFDLDVFFVLRPGLFDQQATFQVIAQPTVQLDSPALSVVARTLAQVVFEIGLASFLGEQLDGYAKAFAAWLLGEPDRELAGGVEHLDIAYIGDAPRPPVLAPTAVPPTTVPMDPGNLTKINHIVVVMMENRSFDHMLGYLSLPIAGNDDILGRGRADVDGLTGDEFNSGLLDNQPRRVFPLSRVWDGPPVPAELRTRPTRFVPDPATATPIPWCNAATTTSSSCRPTSQTPPSPSLEFGYGSARTGASC